jgi:hypothetical protein
MIAACKPVNPQRLVLSTMLLLIKVYFASLHFASLYFASLHFTCVTATTTMCVTATTMCVTATTMCVCDSNNHMCDSNNNHVCDRNHVTCLLMCNQPLVNCDQAIGSLKMILLVLVRHRIKNQHALVMIATTRVKEATLAIRDKMTREVTVIKMRDKITREGLLQKLLKMQHQDLLAGENTREKERARSSPLTCSAKWLCMMTRSMR